MPSGERSSPSASRRSTSVRRRQLLAAAGATIPLGVAGCIGSGSDSDSNDGTDGNGTESADDSTDTADGEASDDDSDGSSDDSDGSGDEPATWAEGGPPDRESWSVTFSDRFESGELDRSTWQNGFGFAPQLCPDHDGPDHCAVEEYAYVEDGRLVTEASEDTPEIPEEENPPDREDQPSYSVGAVHTEGVFEQEFGYFEAKSKVPGDPGTLPACWFYIDITEHDWREPHVYEAPGSGRGETIEMGARWWYEEWESRTIGANSWDDSTVEVDPPTDEAFHVYAVEWGPDYLAWYVDGEQVGRSDHPEIAEHLAGEPVYWVLNHGVFDAAEWVGDPAETEFPSYHEFEWVRAWQREDWE